MDYYYLFMLIVNFDTHHKPFKFTNKSPLYSISSFNITLIILLILLLSWLFVLYSYYIINKTKFYQL